MIGVKLNPSSPLPLHEQVAAGIRRSIADGTLPVGRRLPPTRDLAAALDINANTVLRALRHLRDEGLLDFRRGRGITVIGTPDEGELRALVVRLVHVADRQGLTKQDIIELIEEMQ